MAVTVRRATREDARTIAEFALKLVEQHRQYDPVRFARLGDLEGMTWYYGEQTEAEDAIVLLAEDSRSTIGFAYLEYQPRNYVDLALSSVRLHDIYVEESVRSSGAGRKLIEAAIEESKKFEAAKVLLSVAAKNELAQDFFQHLGFRTTMLEMMLELPGQ
jgi:ribosomal protein S18 acetylase RimI-like enzyme